MEPTKAEAQEAFAAIAHDVIKMVRRPARELASGSAVVVLAPPRHDWLSRRAVRSRSVADLVLYAITQGDARLLCQQHDVRLNPAARLFWVVGNALHQYTGEL